MPPSRPLRPGDVLQGRYRFTRPLGDNPAMVSCVCEDTESASEIVLKMLALSEDDHPDLFTRFVGEAQALQRISRGGVVQIIDTFCHEARNGETYFCFVSPHTADASLADKLVRGEQFSSKELSRITSALLGILEYLHGLAPPMHHGDIKPSNVLLASDDGEVLLIDFWGICNRWRAGEQLVGTPGYAAPETHEGEHDAASDLYSLGATLFHLITTRSPLEITGRSERLRALEASDCPAELLELTSRLLEPSKSDRPVSAADASTTLLELLTDAYITPEDRQDNKPNHRPARLLELGPPPRENTELYNDVRRMFIPDFFGRGHAIEGIIGAESDFNHSTHKGVLLFAVAMFSTLGLWAVYAMLYRWRGVRKYGDLVDEGTYVRGRLTSVKITPKHNIADHIEYAYPHEGIIYQGKMRVHASRSAGLRAGEPIGVLYAPEDPERSVAIFYA